MPGRLLVVPVAHVESAAWPTPPGLFLEVDLLPFNAVGQRTGPELGERVVNEGFQPLASLDLIGSRTKRRHRHPSDGYYQISRPVI